MEKLKNKHDHKLTNVLKAVIFSIVMLAPFFAVLSKCLYVACNKNAKESYYGETINDSSYQNVELNKLKINTRYYFMYSEILVSNTSNTSTVYINDLEVISNFTASENNMEWTIEEGDNLYFHVSANNIIQYRIRNSNYTTFYYCTSDRPININFIYLSSSNNLYNNFYDKFTFKELVYNKDSFLDNAFYYAVEDLKNEKLFNWTEDTAIYSAINTMCTGLDVQGGVLPLLLTYWALMTAIYIVFDIVIVVFVKLTHFME